MRRNSSDVSESSSCNSKLLTHPLSFHAHIMYRNISALPNTIVSILEQVREQTGFMGVCAFFGSEPKASGNVTAYT